MAADARPGTQAKPPNLETSADQRATSPDHRTLGETNGRGDTTARPAGLMPITAQAHRIPTLTPAIRESILQAVREGVHDTTAAVLAGVPERTWQQWRAISEGRLTVWYDGTPISSDLRTFLAPLAGEIAAARAVFEARRVRNIARAAETVNERTGQTDWRADAWLLNNHPAYRQDYREYRELHVEQRGTVSHEHRLARQMSDDQLLEALPGEWRELCEPLELPTRDAGAEA